MAEWDAVVVGAGPNGLAAACELARNGARVLVLEADDTIGGGCRTKDLVLPGHSSDVCAAVHPLATVSPFFSTVPIEQYGVRWLLPEILAAHPFEDGAVAVLTDAPESTAARLGADADRYLSLVESVGPDAVRLALGPPLRGARTPLTAGRLAAIAMRSAEAVASRFETRDARALFAGMAAHAMRPLDVPPTAGVALLLLAAANLGHWPLVEGGSQRLMDALGAYLRDHGGVIETGTPVTAPQHLPASSVVLFDLGPGPLLRHFGDAMPARYRRSLERWQRGPAAFKVDWVLDAPIPWRDEASRRAGTVHLGGSFEEIAASERAVADGVVPERPFVLVAQPSIVDPSRAPAGAHMVWGYCHVPNGSTADVTDLIEAQIERFAPGFRDIVVARHTMGPSQLERYNANYSGGDIAGGRLDLRQLFVRPGRLSDPYRIPGTTWFVCSASTPPGPGVHGMCGQHAAHSALGVLARL